MVSHVFKRVMMIESKTKTIIKPMINSTCSLIIGLVCLLYKLFQEFVHVLILCAFSKTSNDNISYPTWKQQANKTKSKKNKPSFDAHAFVECFAGFGNRNHCCVTE